MESGKGFSFFLLDLDGEINPFPRGSTMAWLARLLFKLLNRS
jgi:hypothetical protein